MWRSRISILVILATLGSYTPSRATAKDFIPTGLEIGFDVTRLPYYLWREKTGGQYEFHSSVDFNSILLDIDYGWGSILRKNPPKRPDNQEIIKTISDNWGQYFRIGLGYNFISKNPDHNVAYLGLMYSRSSFSDALYGNLLGNKVYNLNDIVAVDETDKLHAHWLEVAAGIRVQIWQWIYMGCTVRYKFAKRVSFSEKLVPFDVIGWGLNEEEDGWGVNYYIGIRIALRSDAGQPFTSRDKSNQPHLIS